MKIHSLRLIQFRNYEDRKFVFEEPITVFYGSNGKGKTNILEGLYVGTVGRSHRASDDRDMIRFYAEEASIHIAFERQEVPQDLKIKIPRQGKKSITLNENKITQKELVGTLNTVFFGPEDMDLIKGAPKERRHFLDMELSQTSPFYYQQLMLYTRAVQQRNRMLKEYAGRTLPSLEEWDIQIAKTASFLTKFRLKSLEKMNLLASLMHRRLTDGKENLRLHYEQPYGLQSLVTEEKEFYELLKQRLEQDRRRMTTSVGPHRDDILFISDQGDLKRFGSQGQQRTAILAVKLSELEFIKSEVGEYPILLLDDVFSELDELRRKQLLAFIHRRVQTFITTTDQQDVEGLSHVHCISIS